MTESKLSELETLKAQLAQTRDVAVPPGICGKCGKAKFTATTTIASGMMATAHNYFCSCPVEFTQFPFDKTNAGEERKDLAQVPADGAHAEQQTARLKHEGWDLSGQPSENTANAALTGRSAPHATASTQSGPQDSPSRSEIEKLLMALANCYILMQPEGFEVGFICEALGGKPHIHNGKLMLPAPPSPAREKEKAE